MDYRQKYEKSSQNSTYLSPTLSKIDLIREYWSENIHDIEITQYPTGTIEYFDELESYRFKKLEYLPSVINFNGYQGKRVLEVGCGLGIDLVRFARGGAIVTGIDLADNAIELAKNNFELRGVDGELLVMDGEDVSFKDELFDFVYAHGVLAYTANAEKMICEIHRVLKSGGEAILMMYNRNSWLYFLSRLFGFKLGREDAPYFRTYSITEFREMLFNFSNVKIFTVRFPVKTRLHKGVKATIFNNLFVPAFSLVPKSLVNPIGAHLIARAIK